MIIKSFFCLSRQSRAMGNLLMLIRNPNVGDHAVVAVAPPQAPPEVRGRARLTARTWCRRGRLSRAPNGQWEAGRREGRLTRNMANQTWSELGYDSIS